MLKTGKAKTVRQAAQTLGKGEATVHRWLRLYREGGIEKLLLEKKSPGTPKKFSVEQAAKVQKELRDPQGFSSYKEVRLWLRAIEGIKASYQSIYRLVKGELQAKLKVARPRSNKQNTEAVARFIEQLPEQVNTLLAEAGQSGKRWEKLCYWCQDETRLGLPTISGKKLTLKGIKPVGVKQWKFEYFYLYGAVELASGRQFIWEFSHLDQVCFEEYLYRFAQTFPNELHLLQVDNAPSHTATQLKVPDNVILLYQPPYCPEVNAIERLWEYLKSFLQWDLFDELDELRAKVAGILNSLGKNVVRSLTGWDSLLQALSLSVI